MSDKIRILIADDHIFVRRGVVSVLEDEPDFELVGQAEDGIQAVAMAKELNPDVIVMDLVMPHKSGLDATREITAANPGIHILILTSFAEDENVFAAIQAGALSYLMKESSAQELVEAIRDVYQGTLHLQPSLAQKLITTLNQEKKQPVTSADTLTIREEEVLRQIAAGLSNKEIAMELGISERTVHNHVSNVLSKLHLANRLQAALYVQRQSSGSS
jgi:two-component system, NarL family, response regulator LiaR